MCCFFIVRKLLMLKILLVGLTGLSSASRYAYGYHPSAEEFDNLLNEAPRTWTHSYIEAERDRLLRKPTEHRRHDAIARNAKSEAGYFVPKFQYDSSEAKKVIQFGQHPLKQQDLQMASSQKRAQPLQNVGSFLEFNYFSHELPRPLSSTASSAQQTFVRKPPKVATTTVQSVRDKTPVTSSALPEINLKPIAKPNANKYSLNNLYRNNSRAQFPIYFTNPATGTVYAITEMGKSPESITISKNGTIPIFITKEQYERDILQLENEFKQKCQNLQTTSTASTATVKPPHIIRLQKPLSPLQHKISSIFSLDPAIPAPLRKPSPVLVKTELIVKDKKPSATGARPLRKRKTKTKPKRKIKNQKPPGHKTLATTVKQIFPQQSDGPIIILGSRNSYETKEKLSTQLEKPNFDNIFSSAATSIQKSSHNVNKRSLEPASGNFSRFENSPQYKNISFTANLFAKEKLSVNATEGSTKQSIKNLKNFSGKIESKLKYKEIQTKLPTKQVPPGSVGDSRNFINTPTAKTDKNTLNNFNSKNISTTFINLTLNNSLKIPNISTKNLHKNSKLLNFKTTNKKNNFLSDFIISSDTEVWASNRKNTYYFMPFQRYRNKRSAENMTTKNLSSPRFIQKSNKTSETVLNPKEKNSTESAKNHNQTNLIVGAKKKKTLKHLKKRKRISKVKLNNPMPTFKKTNKKNYLRTKSGIPRPAIVKQSHKNKKLDTEYYIFDVEENYDDDEDDDGDDEQTEEEYEDDDEDEENEGEEEEEIYKDPNEILDYDDDEKYPMPATEVSLSAEDLSERPPASETSSYPEIESENSALEIEQVDFKSPVLDYDNNAKIGLKTKSTYIKKRIRRRPPQLKINDDYDDDDDDNSITSNLGEFLRMIFYPIQVVVSNVMDSFSGKDTEEKYDDDPNISSPYTKYTSYNSALKQQSSDDYDEDYDSNESGESSLGSWFRSWFAFNRRNKKIGSATATSVKVKPTKSSSWLPAWLGFGANDRLSTEAASHEDYDEYDKWFASWFGEMKPKAAKRATTTTSTTTQIPHVPMLTIVDPMRNPQNWIGILAHHIINQTSTSTSNPLKDIWSRVTTTTTENPEISRKISYDKYQIWRLKPQDENQVKALEEYKKSEDGIKLQWLKGPSLRGLTDVLVPPKMLVDFQASLTFELVDHEVLIFDVGKAIAYEKTKEDYFFTTTQKPKKHVGRNPTSRVGMTWSKYYKFDDIVLYLESMRMRFPHLVELIHIGRSYEGRPLIVMKIESKEAAAVNSAHTAHQRNKLRHKKRIGLANAVFIEAGLHGMEWIGPATATWIINELLRIMKKNVTDDQSFIRNTTWYIMPVLNPDGYVYSHEYDRFWKKSRSRHISRPSGILNSAMTWWQKKRTKEKICFGVDLDRNWHYQWGRRGSSKSACNEFYAGPTPFSEPETKAVSDFLMDYRTQIKLFLSMQSYGQIISYPYKANTTYDSERLDDLLDVAMVGTDGLRKKGSKSRYKIDSSNDLTENRSGCSDAFAAYEVGIPFSYTLQLADNGVHGYLLPSAAIESTAKDSFEIITGMLDYI